MCLAPHASVREPVVLRCWRQMDITAPSAFTTAHTTLSVVITECILFVLSSGASPDVRLAPHASVGEDDTFFGNFLWLHMRCYRFLWDWHRR